MLLLAACGGSGAQQQASPVARFAYAITGDAIVAYAVNGTNLPQTTSTLWPSGQRGDLRPVRYLVPTEKPRRIVIDKQAELAFVLTQNFGLSVFRINLQNGLLTSLHDKVTLGGPTPGGFNVPFTIALSPSGSYLVVGFTPRAGPLPKIAYIKSYEINSATGDLTYRGAAVSGVSAAGIQFDPSGQYLYASSLTSGDVRSYSFNPQTGALQSIGTPQPVASAGSMVMDPAGRFLYVSERGATLATQRVIVFRQESNGTLTQVSAVVVPGEPRQLILHPGGGYLYVSAFASSPPAGSQECLCVFSVNATTGELTGPVQKSPVASEGLAIDPSGEFLYKPGRFIQLFTIDKSNGTVSLTSYIRAPSRTSAVVLSEGTAAAKFWPQLVIAATPKSGSVGFYSVNLGNGALELKGKTSMVSEPMAIATDSDNGFVYISNGADNSIAIFKTDTEGKLTFIAATSLTPPPQPPVTTPFLDPASMAIDPSGRFLFIALRLTADIVIADRDQSTGAITISKNSYHAAGFGCKPSLVTADPAGAFVYVSCVNGGTVVWRTAPPGAPQLVGSLPVTATAVSADAGGKYLYSADGNNSKITSHNVETNGPVLHSSNPLPTGQQPVSIAVDPLGRWVYSLNRANKTISVFQVVDDDLTTLPAVSLRSEVTPTAARVDPSGQWLWVLNDEGAVLDTFRINQDTGDLTKDQDKSSSSEQRPIAPNEGQLAVVQRIS
jgi:6-phosphogluconolactonase (cycloisomerase 2 family)